MFDGYSDYVVEEYIRPAKVRVPLINDERADILGNFDDARRQEILRGDAHNNNDTEDNPFTDPNNTDDDVDDDNEVDDFKPETEEEKTNTLLKEGQDIVSVHVPVVARNPKVKERETKPTSSKTKDDLSEFSKTGHLSDTQINSLIRGTSKINRFVLYVTNLNYETTKSKLIDFFTEAGEVKSARIPKTRKNAFAFIEMQSIDGFKRALALHHRPLDGYKIKIQVSEGGKKKSANKKNILKQKNRKLAEMRNETKQFTKSGKGYSKDLKHELKQQKLQQIRRMSRKKSIKKS